MDLKPIEPVQPSQDRKGILLNLSLDVVVDGLFFSELQVVEGILFIDVGIVICTSAFKNKDSGLGVLLCQAYQVCFMP